MLSAGVINADDHPLIAGTPHTQAVFDEATNRLWLDVTETLGLSYNQVSSMLGGGQEYEGWLLPDVSDVAELLGNANIPYPTAPPYEPGFNQAISDFLDIYGSPSGTDLGDQAELWVNNPFGRIALSDGEYGNLDAHRARLNVYPSDTADTVHATLGTALYRPVPSTLTLTIDASSIVELGGTTRATVQRNTGTNGDLEVTLLTSDTGEATVPPNITIQDGSESATFQILAVDDQLLDGTQEVTITAAATGYASVSETLDVTDHETLSLVIAADSIAEDAGPAATTATVTRSNLNTKLTASDAAAADEFGQSVSISGTTAIVGAHYDGDNGGRLGSAYIFEQSGGVWSQIAKLTASDGGGGDQFGSSVSISDNLAIVGAVGDNDNGIDSGSAYIFERSGGTWSQVAKLTASDGAFSDYFGASVSISGTAAIVGSNNAGSAYVFERSGGTWSQVAKLSNGEGGDRFGSSVSISDNTAIAGASGDDVRGNDSGSAYIFEKTDGTWNQVAKLTASDGAAEDIFGLSVSVSNNVAIVGARYDDDKGEKSGSAYVFEESGGTWSQVAKLIANDGAAGDVFGASVSISGTTAIVGAWGDEDKGDDSGSAYIFERSGGTWSQVAKLTASDGAAQDKFGRSVSISGIAAIVGAHQHSDVGDNSGSAYIFDALAVNLSSDDESEATVPRSVPIPWGQPSASFNVDAVNDAVMDGNQTVTITASANGYIDGTDMVEVTDDDEAGITVAPTSGLSTTEEQSTATFTIALASEPTANVTVDLSTSDATEGTVLPTALTFTPNDWNLPLAVTVTGVNDDVDDGDIAYTIVTAAASSSDPNYNGLNAADVSVTNQDDDVAGITVAVATPFTTTEAGGEATFTIVLDSEPTADVTIDLTSSDDTEGSVSPSSVVFTPDNWDTAQTVTVTGVDDKIDDDHVGYMIETAAASSTDPKYNGLDGDDVLLTNEDDDTAGITVSTITGDSTEVGGMAAFTIVLTSEPIADVAIGISSTDESEGTVSRTDATFTQDDWYVPQIVFVTGVDDKAVDGDVAYAIETAAASSSDTKYDGLDANDVTLANLDDDVAGFTVTESAGNTQVADSGAMDTFTVVLDAEPLSDVVISVTGGDTDEATVDESSLRFTPDTWDDAKTVTVTGVDDFVLDGDQTTSITLSVDDANSDDAFDPLADQTVSVTTIDDGYHGWQNRRNRFDVDGRDGVTPVDVLTLIAYLNGDNTSLPAPPATPPPYYDVNDDGACTPLDVLIVIVFINNRQLAESGEGEAASSSVPMFAIEMPSSPYLADRLTSPRPAPNGQTSVYNERSASRWATARTADDELDAERTWRAVSDAIWSDGAVEELDAAFAELGAVLPDLAAGLS